MSKTFCIAPWHDVHVITDGTFKGCCVMSNGEQEGRLCNNGSPLTVANAGIKGAINSDTSKQLRLDMLHGKWHTNCKRCKDEEDSGMRSMRLLYESRWVDNKQFTFEDAQKITNPETGELSEDHTPFYYDIQLGNLCNLKCRICSPIVSSSWIPDYMKMMKLGDKAKINVRRNFDIEVEHVKGKQYNITPNPFAWAESDKFWEDMSSIKSKIDRLYLIGGEPMMIHRHFKFLEECVESGDSKNIVLQYDTNLTNIPQKVMGYWKEFKFVEIGFSIDGKGKELEYMRHPVKWNHMLRNINRMEEFAKQNNNIKLYDSVTISMYNVLHILDYIEWKVKAGYHDYHYLFQYHDQHFGTHPLHVPRFLNLRTMPLSAKIEVAKRYNEWRDKMLRWCDDIDKCRRGHYSYRTTLENLRKAINGFVDNHIAFFNQSDNSKEMHRFWSFTNDLDKVRGESFKEVFPEEHTIFSDYAEKPQWKFLPTEVFYEE